MYQRISWNRLEELAQEILLSTQGIETWGPHNVSRGKELIKFEKEVLGTEAVRYDAFFCNFEPRAEWCHRDFGENFNFKWSVNIPLENTQGTSTTFYSVRGAPLNDNEMIEHSKRNATNHHRWHIPTRCKLLEEHLTQGIFAIDTSIPHAINNPNNHLIRKVYCLRMPSEWHPDQIFKNYD